MNIHVVPITMPLGAGACHTIQDRWGIQEEGSIHYITIWDSNESAIKEAVRLVTGTNNKIVIHGRDGCIRSRDFLGINPFPYNRELFA